MKININGTIVANDDKWVYEWFEMEATSPKDVQELLDKANGERVDIYIDSGGGDVFAGSSIYSAIRQYKGAVTIHVVGLAASAASVIACAAKSDIAPTAMLMVHNVATTGKGDYHVMGKTSETLQKANKAVAAAYVAKSGMTEEEALQLMDCETWLTAKEAVEKGLIDEISEPENARLVASISNVLPQEVIQKIKNTVKIPRNKNDPTDFITAKAKLELLKMKGVM